MLALPPGPPPLLLFAEDFDEPVMVEPPPPEPELEPEIIEPVFSLADLAAAREEAAATARAATQADLAEAHRLQVRLMLAEISQALADARQAAERLSEAQATGLAGLLLDTLRAALPAACARHGAGEIAAILQILRPALRAEPLLTIHLHPATAEALAADLAGLRAALPGDIQIVPDPALQQGDVRIAWRNGAAVRDTALVLAAIDGALGAAGLLTDTGDPHHDS